MFEFFNIWESKELQNYVKVKFTFQTGIIYEFRFRKYLFIVMNFIHKISK